MDLRLLTTTVPAACSSYRRELLDEIGGWDTRLINSFEDSDLSRRMIDRYKDMKIPLCEGASVTHYQDLSFPYLQLVQETNSNLATISSYFHE